MKRFAFVFIFVVFHVFPASARQPDGTLGVIRGPHSGKPAIATPGATIEIQAIRRGDVRLLSDSSEHPLVVAWREQLDGSFEARGDLPRDMPSGTYTLVLEHEGGVDRSARAVFIIEAFPERYLFAHITDAYIGQDEQAAVHLRAVISAINDRHEIEPEPDESDDADAPLPVAFVLVTGDLTASGAPEEFQQVVDILATCAVPVFVVPGEHDAVGMVYEAFFGPATYRFVYGEDGYLAIDTRDPVPADDAHPQQSLLERYRRELMPRRWSIGFTHRYDPMMGMRAQMVLFIDAPLDHLVFGHWGRANTEEERLTPWGHTGITVTPSAAQGAYRFIEVGPHALRPGPVETIAE